ncbi:DegT/DnrJ/EryC1/StrS family aminotransferase, partial [uncultured Helicobacter sp.]|uniref:DegT/DnrJ/EryC1/StrS family aminotransferase n=1 Tax=uncultured Helicobacter sp. TaxID=175537 RepID=UPI00374E42E2
MNIQFINLKAQYKAYKDEIDTAIAEVLDSSAYIMGPSVGALESDLSAFCGARYTRAVSSGTDALLIAL